MKFDDINCQGKNWLHRVAEKDTGIHRHHGVIDKARFIYNQDDKKLYYGGLTDWNVITRKFDILALDAQMLMGYWPLPDGWNIVTTNNDMTVAITTDSSEVGEITGGWTITGIESAGGHDHGGVTGEPDSTIANGTSDRRTPSSSWRNHTHTLQVDGNHIHGFDSTWRPAWQKFVEAAYIG